MFVAMLLTTMLQFPFYIGFGLVYSSFNGDLFDSQKFEVNFGANNTYNQRRNYCEDKSCINYKNNKYYMNPNTNHNDNLEDDYQSICNLPNESGPCLASIPRYFYNVHNGKCEKFIYGGCGGNGNNFLDIKSCEEYCIQEPSNDICLLPQETGPCKSFIERYYYNPIKKQCETFLYGGCGGNGNNFVDIKSCSKQCIQDTYQRICLQPNKRGPCMCSFKRYFFNINTKQCEEFIYGGCEGNDNNFCTLELCQQKCSSNYNSLTLMTHNTGLAAPNKEICALGPEAGPCLAYMPQYYYDPNTGQCQIFVYGGCGGNGNNFKDIESCKRFCIEETSFKNLCSLPPDKGPCKGILKRYYYNPATKDCEQFIYGGCKGNANNFISEDVCEETCEPGEKLPPLCYLSFDKGPCNGNYKRYYYDQHTGKCEVFIYGGCRGNANNFIAKDMCEEICD